MRRSLVVTIDGPAGVGKSTVARRLGRRLGFRVVSSGAIYRAIAWRVLSGAALADVLARSEVAMGGTAEAPTVWVDGVDVTGELGGPAVGELASRLSQRSAVRAFADRIQRQAAVAGPLVVEGRDAGTVVFPEAACKFYLDASLEARAGRREAELAASGSEALAVRDALAARDLADTRRALAPLRRPADAFYVDSSGLSVDEVVELMARAVERACSTASSSA